MNAQADLDVDTCVAIRGTCPMEYAVCGNRVEFHFGSPSDGFHFVFDAEALGALLTLGAEAMGQLRPREAASR